MATKHTTRCNILNGEGVPCGAEIAITSGMPPLEVGMPPDAKTKAFIVAIVSHLQKKHPGIAVAAMNTMEQYLGFSVLGLTGCDDPGAVTFMSKFADHLCRQATMPVSDAMLVELMARAQLTAEEQSKIGPLLQYVRNFQLRKIGHGPAQVPANSLLESPVSA
jgi:hypothetical protein